MYGNKIKVIIRLQSMPRNRVQVANRIIQALFNQPLQRTNPEYVARERAFQVSQMRVHS